MAVDEKSAMAVRRSHLKAMRPCGVSWRKLARGSVMALHGTNMKINNIIYKVHQTVQTPSDGRTE